MNIEQQRELAEQMFPIAWAETFSMPGERRRKTQKILRSRAVEQRLVEPILAKGGNCSNCAHSFVRDRKGKLACHLDSDFYGDQIVTPDHVCSRHKERT